MSLARPEISKAILDFAVTIGIAREDLIEAEDEEQMLLFVEDLPKASIDKVDHVAIESLLNSLGHSTKLTFSSGGLGIAEFSDPSSITEQLSSLRTETEHSPSATFQWHIDKVKLIGLLELPSREGCKYSLFLFAQSFRRLLSQSLVNPGLTEKRVWNSAATHKAVVVLLDEEFTASGELLAVVGNYEDDIEKHLAIPNGQRLEMLDKQFESCKSSVRWEQEWLSFATPARFVVTSSSSDNEMYKLLAGIATNVSLLFTADRARNSNGEVFATFATEKSRCDVPFVTVEDVRSDAFTVDQCWEVVKLADWAYGDKWEPDRLRFVQLAVANALTGEKNRNALELLWRAKGIRKNIEWQWKSFMEGKVDQYTSEERELESEVAETVSKVDSQVADLIKGISGTVLGAVGVVIGTFVAAAFKDKFNDGLFVFGVVTYAIYVFFFPGLYSMYHSRESYCAMFRLFQSRKLRVESVLGKAKTEKIIGDDIEKAKKRFRWSFGISIVALIGILIACAVISYRVPKFYAKDDASSADNPAVTEPKFKK